MNESKPPVPNDESPISVKLADPEPGMPSPPPPPQPGMAAQLPMPQAAPYGIPQPPPAASPFHVAPPEGVAPPPPKPRRPIRGILLGLVGLAIVGSVVGALALKPAAPKKARSIGARLDLAAGDVTVKDAASDGKALSGTPLGSGASVMTGKGARALVRTGEGAAFFLRNDTKLALADRGVELSQGEVWLDAPKVEGDALETKVGNYTVSASDAGVDISRDDKGGITVYVARGLAILTSPGGRVEIAAGEQAKASGDGKPTVTSVAFWSDWTGGMGDQKASRLVGSGTGRLYGLDPSAPNGAPARKLGIAKQVVKAVIRDGIAETEVDETFSNPAGAPIEGWYWFTIPTSATVTGFALETNGQLVEGEVIEKREAAAQYATAVHSGNEPALLEWVDGRTYRARIYPIPASGTRRIVLRYSEMLPNVEGKTRYVYPLRSDDPVRFDEFALSVDVGTGNEQDVDVASSLDARVESGHLVSMRRSGYVPRADFQLEITNKKKKPPVQAWRFQAGADQADYVMLRYTPDKDFSKDPPANADVVVVVDTSAGGDESARQLRIAAAEATLRALSASDHFALVTLDVAPTVVYPKDGLAEASGKEIDKALEKLSEHSMDGATDIGAMFEPALARLHGKEQAAVIYVGDGAPTSGETGSDALLERLRRSLTGSRARFFAIGTGSDARHDLLGQLARAGGGQYVRVDESGQTTGQALRLASAIKTAAITDVAIDVGAGLDQPLYSATGKLARGEELVLLARTHHPLPDKVTIHGRIAGKDFDDKYDVKVDTTSVTASLVPRLWASEYAHRLMGSGANAEENRSQILQLGVEYALITPFTSSIALDSENAYARQGIPRRTSRVRGVRLTAIDSPADEKRLLDGVMLPAAPAAVMGCSKSSPFSDSSNNASDESAQKVNAPIGAAATPAATATTAYATSEGAKDSNQRAYDIAPAQPTMAAPPPSPPRDLGGALANGAGKAPDPGPGGAGLGHGTDLSFGDGPGRAEAKPSSPVRRAPVAAPTANAKVWDGDDRASKQTKKGAIDALDKSQLSSALAPASARPSVPRVNRALARCSDVASRPLAERLVLWQKRARKTTSALELATMYDQAYSSCELPDWRDEAALLDVLQQRITTEQAAETVLAHFASYNEAQQFLAKNLLRRTVDVRIAAAVSRVLYNGVDWLKVDREIADLDKPEKQLAALKKAMLIAPGDPQGDVRLVRLYARTNQRPEALALGRRMRDRGFLTPTLAQQLGDVLVEAGEQDEALRTYSEIVEFDGESPASRKLLGDIFYRQGWYAASYRQYKTLTDLDGKNPLAWLRLANAAAGAGRIDEALRIDRDVSGGEGTPGPNDPRMFARLLSAARLGQLLDHPDPANGITTEAVSRKLKELSLFSGPGTLALLTWEDLDAGFVVGAADEKKETLAGEMTDASAVGLYAVLTAPETWARSQHAVRYRSEILTRKVPFKLVTLDWNGKTFSVTVKKGEVRPASKQELL
jgi:tetratricopeptide (TPR) repeat protein